MQSRWAQVWKYRHFWMALVGSDLRARYRRSILGVGWSLLNPLMMTVIFCIVFSSWMGNPDWRYYAPYFLGGVTIWEFMKQSALQGCMTFLRNESYIRQSPLPLAIYTFRTLLSISTHFFISLGLLITTIAVLNQTDHLTPFYALWAVIPAVFLLILFCWSIITITAFLHVYFHDTQHLTEVLFSIAFFVTPIIYPPTLLTDKGLGWVLEVSPAVIFFDLIRIPLLTGVPPSLWAFGKATLMTSAMAIIAFQILSRLERKLIFHL